MIALEGRRRALRLSGIGIDHHYNPSKSLVHFGGLFFDECDGDLGVGRFRLDDCRRVTHFARPLQLRGWFAQLSTVLLTVRGIVKRPGK